MIRYATPRANILKMANELFDLITAGKIVAESRLALPLAAAGDAHRALEQRKTTGATVPVP
jgi:NADPH2:quinone reductase